MQLIDHSVYLNSDNQLIDPTTISKEELSSLLGTAGINNMEDARQRTIARQIMNAHSKSKDASKMEIRFDALVSHDITYVGIIQSARIGGLKEFPIPYALTNCHNSLCAVGGTINEDDHVFGLSAAKKYGGIFVPPHLAVIHQYAREMLTSCGNMILGSDSHTRYGCFGTMGFGEGGPELVRQLLENTYDINTPEVVLVYLENAPHHGVGPHDVAIAMVGETFKNGFVKNRVLEFAGPGINNLSMDYRTGIEVMTTETACLSSIWITDDQTEEYFRVHGRQEAYHKLQPKAMACYDRAIRIDLSKIEPMIALPFHPGNAYTIHSLLEKPEEIFAKVETDVKEKFSGKVNLDLLSKIRNGKIVVDQGIIAGCAGGTYENLCEASDILRDKSIGNGYFSLSVYPSSMPVNYALTKDGIITDLQAAGVINKTAFCGPCFGAGDVPANEGLSIRHTTRNFPNREGSKPDQGQLSAVALMDARSIAATAANGGILTPADEIEYNIKPHTYVFNADIYQKRIYNGFHHPNPDEPLRLGPNITDWPEINPMPQNLLLELAAVINDSVTTTDELIPSGETSSLRSNPLKLAEFTLSRRVPEYVSRAKAIHDMEISRIQGKMPQIALSVLKQISSDYEAILKETGIGSVIFAVKPGDGSAREQAASSQRVLGGLANIARDYATKRYRSNCINWGIVPFTLDQKYSFNYQPGDFIFIPNIKTSLEKGIEIFPAKVISRHEIYEITLRCAGLSLEERHIILSGCLMNFYKK